MAIETWGALPKSQVDSETIEEAIARLIQAHLDDANAHLAAGESLETHKASATIDHVADSIITDKIKDGVTLKTEKFYYDWLSWVGNSGFTEVKDGTGAIYYNAPSVGLYTGNLSGNMTMIRSTGKWYAIIVTGKKYSGEFSIVFVGTNTNQTTYLLLGPAVNTPPTETAMHAGFKIINNAIWASSADGSTQELTDTGETIGVGPQFTRLRVVVDPGVDVKFYHNDVLVATHSTKIPTPPEGDPQRPRLYLGVVTGENAVKQIHFGRFILSKEV